MVWCLICISMMLSHYHATKPCYHNTMLPYYHATMLLRYLYILMLLGCAYLWSRFPPAWWQVTRWSKDGRRWPRDEKRRKFPTSFQHLRERPPSWQSGPDQVQIVALLSMQIQILPEPNTRLSQCSQFSCCKFSTTGVKHRDIACLTSLQMIVIWCILSLSTNANISLTNITLSHPLFSCYKFYTWVKRPDIACVTSLQMIVIWCTLSPPSSQHLTCKEDLEQAQCYKIEKLQGKLKSFEFGIWRHRLACIEQTREKRERGSRGDLKNVLLFRHSSPPPHTLLWCIF